MRFDSRFLAVSLGVLALGTAGLTGCARVKPEQLDAELAKIRQEMQAGDSGLATRLDSTDRRVTELNATVTARLDSLQRDLDSLGTEFRTSVQRMETAVRFNTPVHFDYDDATIRESDVPLLDRFAQVVQRYYAGSVLTIEGFADPSGSRAYNLRLGRQRADAVRDYLVTNGGLTAGQIRTVSYGEARDRLVVPGAQGPGEEGLENRRVAFVIDLAGGDTPSQTASVE